MVLKTQMNTLYIQTILEAVVEMMSGTKTSLLVQQKVS